MPGSGQGKGASLKRPGLCYGIGYAVLLLVAIVSLMPAPELGGSDKLLHLLTYAGLGAGYALLVVEGKNLMVIACGLVLYGVLLEWLQGLTGYRMMDTADMLANSIGVVMGLSVWLTPLPHRFRELEKRLG